MTGDELKTKGIALYGERRWASRLAQAIGKSRSQIWRYSLAEKVPVTVAMAVATLRRSTPR